MIKQVIVVRTDLNMRKGKLAAQVAHASMKVFFDKMNKWDFEDEEDCNFCLNEVDCKMQDWANKSQIEALDVFPNTNPCKYYQTNIYKTFFSKEMEDWKNGSFAKIVVGCNSEEELHELKRQADEAGIVNALILDNGNTEFKGVCSNCEGSGHVSHVSQVNVSGYKDLILDVQCHICKGTGKVNKPTYTCLAIGPDEADKIDKITGGLKLL